MTASLAERDPLEPNLLPAAPFWNPTSADGPSGVDSRPFGLTRAAVIETKPVDLAGTRYDHDRQITVTADGTPLTMSPRKVPTSCTQTTTHDMVHSSDSVNDD